MLSILKEYRWLIWVFLVIGCWSGITNSSVAQVPDDLGYWNLLVFKKSLDSSNAFSFKQGIRLDQKLSNFNNVLFQMDYSRQLSSSSGIIFGYRYGARSLEGGITNRYSRFQISFKHKRKLVSNVKATYRLRIQSRYKHYENDGSYGTFTNRIRNYLKLTYDTKGTIHPYTHVEVFNDLGFRSEVLPLYRVRSRTGLDFEWSDRFESTLYYNIQWQDNGVDFVPVHAIGTHFTFTF